jgi:hypothetical protein
MMFGIVSLMMVVLMRVLVMMVVICIMVVKIENDVLTVDNGGGDIGDV